MIFLIGAAMGLFAAPNQTGIMNSLPPDQRGSGAGMAATFQNSATVLSIGMFFSLIIVGLSSTLPAVLYHGLVVARRAACRRREGLASAAGGEPVRLVPRLQPDGHAARADAAAPAARDGRLPDRPQFFPTLVSHPFASGIHTAFYFAAGCCLVAAVASWLRGGKYYYKADVAEVEEARAGRSRLTGVCGRAGRVRPREAARPRSLRGGSRRRRRGS